MIAKERNGATAASGTGAIVVAVTVAAAAGGGDASSRAQERIGRPSRPALKVAKR